MLTDPSVQLTIATDGPCSWHYQSWGVHCDCFLQKCQDSVIVYMRMNKNGTLLLQAFHQQTVSQAHCLHSAGQQFSSVDYVPCVHLVTSNADAMSLLHAWDTKGRMQVAAPFVRHVQGLASTSSLYWAKVCLPTACPSFTNHCRASNAGWASQGAIVADSACSETAKRVPAPRTRKGCLGQYGLCTAIQGQWTARWDLCLPR